MLLKNFISFILFIPMIAMSQQAKIDLRHRPPEISITEKKISGPIIDIMDELLTSINITPFWMNVPWPRTLLRAKNGEVDIVLRHSMTPDREEYLLPMLIGYEQRVVYYLLGPHIKNVKQYQQIEQLDKLTFGLLRRSYYGPHIENITSKKKTTFTNNIDQLMEMLLTKRIDVMPIQNLTWAEISYAKIKDRYNNAQYQIAEVNESFLSGKYISIPKLSKLNDKYHKLNCLLYQWRSSGKIDAIYQQYKITPYIQLFNTIESHRQAMSCD